MRPRGVPETVNPVDHPVTYVIADDGSDVHLFIPEYFEMEFVRFMAENFSRRVQEPVKVFHDSYREKYRLCPVSSDTQVFPDSYGTFRFDCDFSEPKRMAIQVEDKKEEPVGQASGARIPRPKNSWILYRASKQKAVLEENPGITAAEISTIIAKQWKEEESEVKEYWQNMAASEDRKHKEMYPDYKFTTKKSSPKDKAT